MAVTQEEQIRLANALARASGEAHTAQELYNQALNTGIDLEQRKLELLDAQARKAQATYEVLNASGSATTANLQAAKKEASDLAKAFDEAAARSRELGSATNSLANQVRGMVGITDQWRNSAVVNVAAQVAGGRSISQVISEARGEFSKTITKADMAGSAMLKVTEIMTSGWMAVVNSTYQLATGLDNAVVAMNRATGAAPRFGASIVSLEDRLNAFGVNASRAGNAISALYSGSSAFTEMTPNMRARVAESTAILDVLGISAETSARNIDIMTRSMGMTGSQAAASNQQLFATAQQFGISTTKMLEGFHAVAPEMMKFGSSAVSVYTRLQIVAKQTGLEVDKMLSIVAQFDKFETAADSVGKLNAILGGPFLHAMHMVMVTDPTERLRMLSGAVKQAGMSFDTMGYYMRQTVANAMGLSSVNDLALIMRGRFDLVSDSTSQSAADIEKLAQETLRYNNLQEEFAQVARQLAVALYPIIPVLKSLAQFLQQNEFIISKLVPMIIGLKAGMFALNAITLGVVGGFGGMAAALWPVIAVVGTLSLALAALTSSQDGLFGISSGINQIAASVNAVPESKTTKFTQLMEKTDQLAGKSAALGAAATSGLAMSAAGGQRGGVITKVTQPIQVDLSIGEDHIRRRIVNVFQDFKH